MARRLPRALTNPVSYLGAAIAVISFVVLITLILTHIFLAPANPYVGVVTYLVFPVFLIAGVLLIPIGMIWDWRRRKRAKKEIQDFPVIDFNLSEHRNGFLLFISGAVLFIMVSAIGSYKAYEFTDSVTFCGTLCHTVMHPEYTAYKASPHARVACADCHIGSGAGWYVKSKLSGMYQVYATLTDRYPRPIPTPIKDLRPSRDTCEECHWPAQFYGDREKLFTHYLDDEKNTEFQQNMLIKVGGGDPTKNAVSGVHWHTFLSHDIYFISPDEHLQTIPWVRSRNRITGEIKTFVDKENPPADTLLARATKHLLDCMDCHNRPTHIFHSPSAILNDAIYLGRIDKRIPTIKGIGEKVLSAEYKTTPLALEKIAEDVWDYYRGNYPDSVKTQHAEIEAAVDEMRARFQQNIFPEMKIFWTTYPDNIGHLYFPGCFRCHDGKHVTEYGETLSKDCKTCHLILSRRMNGKLEETLDPQGLDFRHPVDIGEAWKEMLCFECHAE